MGKVHPKCWHETHHKISYTMISFGESTTHKSNVGKQCVKLCDQRLVQEWWGKSYVRVCVQELGPAQCHSIDCAHASSLISAAQGHCLTVVMSVTSPVFLGGPGFEIWHVQIALGFQKKCFQTAAKPTLLPLIKRSNQTSSQCVQQAPRRALWIKPWWCESCD